MCIVYSGTASNTVLYRECLSLICSIKCNLKVIPSDNRPDMFRYDQTRRRNGKRRSCILDDPQLKLPLLPTENGWAGTHGFNVTIGRASQRPHKFYFGSRNVLTLITNNNTRQKDQIRLESKGNGRMWFGHLAFVLGLIFDVDLRPLTLFIELEWFRDFQFALHSAWKNVIKKLVRHLNNKHWILAAPGAKSKQNVEKQASFCEASVSLVSV